MPAKLSSVALPVVEHYPRSSPWTLSTAPTREDAWIAVILLVVAFTYFCLSLTGTFELWDEGHLFVQFSRVAHGEVPLRDYPDVYGPAVFWLNGLILRFFDGRIVAVRVGIALFKAATVALTYLVTRFVVGRPFALTGAALATAYWGRLIWKLGTPYAAIYIPGISLLSVFLLIRALVREAGAGAFFLAGIAAGATILFKQSIGVFHVYGMVLALWAVGMLESRARPRGGVEVGISGALWLGAGLLVIVAVRTLIRPADYVLHFLPLHLLMALVAVAAVRHGQALSFRPLLTRPVLAFAGGCMLAPAVALVGYAAIGGAGELFENMFVLSWRLKNYYYFVWLPPLTVSAFALGSIAALSGLVLLACGTARRGAPLAVLGFAACAWSLVSAGWHGTPPVSTLMLWSDLLLGVQGPITALGVTALLAAHLLGKPGAAIDPLVRVLLPLLFVHMMTVFQVFPRASYNLFLHAGETVPLLTVLLARWYEAGAAAGSTVSSRLVSALCILTVPVWMAVPSVTSVWSYVHPGAPMRALHWPAARGIRLLPADAANVHLDDLERLVSYLERVEPKDAPVFLLTWEPMIFFLSGRAPLFPREQYYLNLLAFDLLPDSDVEPLLAPRDMVDRLEHHPDTIVIRRTGPPSDAFMRGLGDVRRYIEHNYRVEAQLGQYQVLRDRRFDPTVRLPERSAGDAQPAPER